MSQNSDNSGFFEGLKIALFGETNKKQSLQIPSLLEFYSIFKAERALISTDVYSHENISDKNSKIFTVYNIKIKTKTHEYRIAKRFSDFRALHQKIKKKCSFDILKETQFPDKIFFWGNFDISTLETRRTLFQQYLQVLTEKYTTFNSIDFLDFLEIYSSFFVLIFLLKQLKEFRKKSPKTTQILVKNLLRLKNPKL